MLPADVDITCNVDGKVRIKLDSNGLNSYMPISIPGVLTRTAKLYPDHIALVSTPDANGKRTTYTFQCVKKKYNKTFIFLYYHNK